MLQKLGIGFARRAGAFNGRDDEPAQRADRSQAGIDRAVLGFLFLFVPPRKDHGATSAASLAARLFRTGQRHFRRTQVIDQQQIGRGVIDRYRLAVQIK